MSLMPEHVINALDLYKHGYKVFPMGPYYLAFPDGRSLYLSSDDEGRGLGCDRAFSDVLRRGGA